MTIAAWIVRVSNRNRFGDELPTQYLYGFDPQTGKPEWTPELVDASIYASEFIAKTAWMNTDQPRAEIMRIEINIPTNAEGE